MEASYENEDMAKEANWHFDLKSHTRLANSNIDARDTAQALK